MLVYQRVHQQVAYSHHIGRVSTRALNAVDPPMVKS